MNSSSTEFTASDGRKFGFPVGGAFLVLAGVLFWREKPTLWRIAAGLGGSLVLAGALIPSYLGPIHRGWMKLALVISKVTTPVFMGIVYYLVLTPSVLLVRLLGRVPIEHERRNGSFWQPREGRPRGDLTRQF
jgi:hypothetical protein